MKILSSNKKAFHDYLINERIEAGIVLVGDEVKALRKSLVNLTGSFAVIRNNEAFLLNCYIGTYSHAFRKNEEETRRTRKLLLSKREISRLGGAISKKGITIIPLSLYLNDKGRIKVELGIATHKKAHQRKEAIRERDIARETRREVSGRYRF